MANGIPEGNYLIVNGKSLTRASDGVYKPNDEPDVSVYRSHGLHEYYWYHYTTSYNETQSICTKAGGYAYDGIAFRTSGNGDVPVYSYANQYGLHRFSIYNNIASMLGSGWGFEGERFRLFSKDAPGREPVYFVRKNIDPSKTALCIGEYEKADWESYGWTADKDIMGYACYAALALDNTNRNTTNANNVQLYTVNYTSSQTWHVAPNGRGSYSLTCQYARGMALDIYGKNFSHNANVSLWSVNDTGAQDWSFEPVPGFKMEFNGVTHQPYFIYATAPNGSKWQLEGYGNAPRIVSGTNVDIDTWTDNITADSLDRIWILVPIDHMTVTDIGDFVRTGTYTLCPFDATNKYMDAASPYNGANVCIYQYTGSQGQHWVITKRNKAGNYMIRNAASKYYLDIPGQTKDAVDGSNVIVSSGTDVTEDETMIWNIEAKSDITRYHAAPAIAVEVSLVGKDNIKLVLTNANGASDNGNNVLVAQEGAWKSDKQRWWLVRESEYDATIPVPTDLAMSAQHLHIAPGDLYEDSSNKRLEYYFAWRCADAWLTGSNGYEYRYRRRRMPSQGSLFDGWSGWAHITNGNDTAPENPLRREYDWNVFSTDRANDIQLPKDWTDETSKWNWRLSGNSVIHTFKTTGSNSTMLHTNKNLCTRIQPGTYDFELLGTYMGMLDKNSFGIKVYVADNINGTNRQDLKVITDPGTAKFTITTEKPFLGFEITHKYDKSIQSSNELDIYVYHVAETEQRPNLLPNSMQLASGSQLGWKAINGTLYTGVELGHQYIGIKSTNAAMLSAYQIDNPKTPNDPQYAGYQIKPNTTYTYSGLFQIDADVTPDYSYRHILHSHIIAWLPGATAFKDVADQFGRTNYTDPVRYKNITIKAEKWTRLNYTFNINAPNDTKIYFLPYVYGYTGKDIKFAEMKLEQGAQTDYIPNSGEPNYNSFVSEQAENRSLAKKESEGFSSVGIDQNGSMAGTHDPIVDAYYDIEQFRDEQYQLEVRCVGVGSAGEMLHGGSVTETFNLIWCPTYKFTDCGLAKSGLHIQFTSDYGADYFNRNISCGTSYITIVSIYSQTKHRYIYNPVAANRLKTSTRTLIGNVFIPYKDLKSLPGVGDDLDITYMVGTDLHMSIGRVFNGTIRVQSKAGNVDTGIRIVDNYRHTAIVTLKNPLAINEVQILIDDLRWDLKPYAEKRDTYLFPYPFDKEFSIYTSVESSDHERWGVDVQQGTASDFGLDPSPVHVWLDDENNVWCLDCRKSDPLDTSKTMNAVYSASVIDARKHEYVTGAKTVKSTYIANGALLYGEGTSAKTHTKLTDFDQLTNRHTLYRDPRGHLAYAYITKVSYEAQHNYATVTVDMIEETR